VCLGGPAPWEWAIEVKMLRFMGDNGKLNDNIVMHILSPYPEHRSALTDCTKLVTSQLGVHKAIMIYGYDYPGWSRSAVVTTPPRGSTPLLLPPVCLFGGVW
jgi:hypothetical protein